MNEETDVQLYTGGVELFFRNVSRDPVTAIGVTRLAMTEESFDVFADQVAEAALNKRGMEWVSAPASEAEVGWFYGELEIVNVRPFLKVDGMTAINFKAAPAFLLIESGLILRFTRPIQ